MELTNEKYEFYKKIFYGDIERMIQDLELKAKYYKELSHPKAQRRAELYGLICERAKSEIK